MNNRSATSSRLNTLVSTVKKIVSFTYKDNSVEKMFYDIRV